MIVESFYVIQDRGTKMFKKNSFEWTEIVDRSWQIFNRRVAYETAGETCDVMLYEVTLKKDRL